MGYNYLKSWKIFVVEKNGCNYIDIYIFGTLEENSNSMSICIYIGLSKEDPKIDSSCWDLKVEVMRWFKAFDQRRFVMDRWNWRIFCHDRAKEATWIGRYVLGDFFFPTCFPGFVLKNALPTQELTCLPNHHFWTSMLIFQGVLVESWESKMFQMIPGDS